MTDAADPPAPAAVTGPAADPALGAADPWTALRQHTPARLALGRAGAGLPTAELLRFAAAHALARDAVQVALDAPALAAALQAEGWPSIAVHSRAPDRASYLRRPDWGRRLDADSAARLQAAASGPVDLVIVLGDGLSALAVQRHGLALLDALRHALGGVPGLAPGLAPLTVGQLAIGPVVIASQARVALADEVGALLQARLVLVLLGERPGLSAPDSLGAYLTHAPRVGCHDAQRNCVSNIRPAGLAPQAAALRLAWLLREALRLRLTGIGLKDDSALQRLDSTAPPSDPATGPAPGSSIGPSTEPPSHPTISPAAGPAA